MQQETSGRTRAEELARAVPGSPEESELEVLFVLVDAYEEARYPSRHLVPVEVIRFQMVQMELSAQEVAPVFGSAAHMGRYSIANGC